MDATHPCYRKSEQVDLDQLVYNLSLLVDQSARLVVYAPLITYIEYLMISGASSNRYHLAPVRAAETDYITISE